MTTDSRGASRSRRRSRSRSRTPPSPRSSPSACFGTTDERHRSRRQGRRRHRRRPGPRDARTRSRSPRAGASVVVNDLDARAADETAALAGAGGLASPVTSADRSAADALVARAVAAFGRLDVMVTNAGVLRDAVLWKMTDEDFDLVVRTHLRGTFLCARAAAIRMREQAQGGRIIVVGSPAGQYGNFGQTNYAAAKAGIVALRAHLGARARPRGDHRERDRADRVDGDDRDHPDLQAAGRARRGRRAAAGRGAPRARDRHARGLRGTGRVPRLRTRRPGSADRRSGSAAIGSVSTRTRRRS